MARLAHYDVLRDGFDRLLADLLTAWPLGEDVQQVREYLDHGEYGEALSLLAAAGLHAGAGFTPGQARQILDLAGLMDMDDSPELEQLRPIAGRVAVSRAMEV